MPSTRELELAALAYMSYAPFDENKLPTADWTSVVGLTLGDPITGLSATTYVNSSGEVVIAFRGTDDPIGLFQADWQQGNVPGALGWYAPQVATAMRLLADAVAQFPTASITLTGHSLGGGLASLLATYFDLPAIVFDPAPFGAAATGLYYNLSGGWLSSTAVSQQYFGEFQQYLADTYPVGSTSSAAAVALTNLQRSFADFTDGVASYDQRKGNTSGHFLRGEGLEPYRAIFPMASGTLTPVETGATLLTDSVALHSMPLLLAMMSSPSLQAASAQLPSLLPQLMDEGLYAYDDHSQQVNLLNRLLAQQLGASGGAGTAALDRFAQDVLKLSVDGSTRLGGVDRALIAATMEYYYFADLADASPFIDVVPGGVTFDVRRIPPSSDLRGQALLLDRVRDLVTSGTGDLARTQADNAAIWTIQTGSSGLATDGHSESEVQIGSAAQPNVLHGATGDDLLIAGGGDDALYGGSGADVLLSGAGSDLLVGGAGNDHLGGGAGEDVYSFSSGDGFDAIVGNDDDGRLLFDNTVAAGGEDARRLRWIVNPSWHWSSGGRSFDAILVGGTASAVGDLVSYAGGTLLLRRRGSDDWVAIQNYASGDLGLNLYGGPPAQTTPSLPDPTTIATRIRNQVDSAKQTVSPLILDLDGDGVETTHVSAGTHFDHDGNGFAEATGWVGSDDGLLVLDRNGNGLIDNGHELFGNNTLLADGSYAANGFAALAALDANGDGQVSASDAAYAQLRIWKDTNANAVADAGELLTLGAAGVSSIATSYSPRNAIEVNGNEHLQSGAYVTTSGAARAIEDVWFAANTTDTVSPTTVAVGADIEALPDVAGFGNVASLHQAMQVDASGHLQALVTQYSVETDASARAALLQSIIFAWTGVEGVAPDSRGIYVDDARTLGALEAFAGEGFVQGYGTNAGTPNPAANAARRLADAYTTLSAYVDAQLMAQTHLRPLYEGIAVALTADASSVAWDVSAALASLRASYDADARAGEVLLKAFAASLKYDEQIGAPVIAALRAAGDSTGSGFARALFAAAAADIIEGTGGADQISGAGGDDLVLGRDGDDTLGGGAGDDLIEGGAGNDLLYGNSGSDTYLFGRGSGQDTIENADADPGRSDIVELRPDVAEGDVAFSRSGDDLVIAIADTTDRATIRNYFLGNTAAGYAIDGIRFASGTLWDREEINNNFLRAAASDSADALQAFATAAIIHGLGGNDGITGSAQDDALYGDDGDDSITAGSGNDTVAGGAGADALAGGAGNNVYLFGRGDGRDTINAFYDTTAGKLNTLEFAAGILPGDLILRRENYYDLVISIAGTADSITIKDAHYAQSTPIQQLRFADGTTLQLTRVMAAGDTVLSMDAAGVVTAIGTDAGDTINGTGLSNVLDGGKGVDLLAGDAGDDTYFVDTARSHFYWEDSSELWNFLDTVTERPGEGYDTVVARDVYSATLPANTEKLIVQGKLAFTTSFNLTQDVRRRFTGNALDNVIDASAATGGSVGQGSTSGSGIDLGETVVDGGAGADLMIGPATKTRFVVDDPGDVVISNSSVTRIDASISYVLAPGFADLTLAGSAAISGTGNALANVLDGAGNTAANALAGVAGNDTYIVGTGDSVQEAAGDGTDTVRSGASYTLPDNVENLTLTGTSPLSGRGNSLDNVITGTSNSVIEANGNNYLVGGGGNDQLLGAGGSDTYADFDTTTGLDVIYDTSGGADRIQSVLNSNLDVEQLQFSRSGNDLLIAVDAANGIRIQSWYASPANVIESLAINNDGDWYTYTATQIQGRADGVNSAPAVYAGLSTQSATAGQAFTYQIAGNAFVDIESQHSLTYTARLADGSALPSWLTLDSATRTLSGTPPSGSAGTLAIAVLATDAGGLSASSSLSLTIAQGQPLGTPGDDFLVGDAADNVLDGLGGNDVLDGQAGNDQIYGGLGNDTMLGGAGNDYLDDWGSDGYGGNDYLDGGTGTDIMYGGDGNDVYVVDNAGDVASEDQGGGIDEVRSSVTFTLDVDLDNLTLTGTAAVKGTGNTLNNALTGNSGSNTLSGGAGNDTLDGGSAGTDVLRGGSGDDTYLVTRSSGITVSENAGEGADLVRSAVTYTLGSNVENLTLTGSGAINGTGNSLGNVITGNSAGNALSGGAGADTLIGGLGSDSYTVDNVGDVIVELPGEGTDLVSAAVTYTLAAGVENLTLTGSAAINGTGNALDNSLTGNGGSNTLSGGAGADTLSPGSAGSDILLGGAGNDTYVVARSTGITITESAGEGADAVLASVTWTLGNNLENLTLTGSSAISGTGNALDNVLTGNAANNTLNGGAGNDTLDGGTGTDTMAGGAGNDVYYVNVSTDVTTESADAGVDSVNSAVTRTLAANIELLFLGGASAINGTGNSLANLLRGNGANNTLVGGGGTDILEGGAGNDALSNASGNSLLAGGAGIDTLTGAGGNDLLIGGTGNDALTTGAGADVIVFNKGDGMDMIAASTALDNTLSLGGGVLYADLLFQKSGNDLVLKIGASDQITFTGYYASASTRSVSTLQVIIEGTSDYDAVGASALNNKKVERFNFDGLVAAFDAARAANSNLTSWVLTDALAAQYLSGSDTAAIGGDLAYQYARCGSLSNLSSLPAMGILGAAGFGSSPQVLLGAGNLQDATPRLN